MKNKYPYTDIHELNLDWILAKMRELKIEFDEFKVINQISFSGAWDITKQYPAWTIVSDNNIGYVSIQPVPAGVLLTNGDYWREVIDYTAQIAGLQSRVVALEGDMLTVQGDITTINGQITTINNNLTKLNRGYDRIQGKSIGFYCDSWGASYPNWIYKIWNNIGGQGDGFNKSYGGYKMKDIYDNLVDGDTDEADIYIIFGGINDYNGQADPLVTAQAVRDIIASLHTKSPDSEIYFMLPPESVKMNSGLTENYCLEWYRTAIYKAANHSESASGYKAGIIDCNCLNGMELAADDIHPASSYLDKMGNLVSQFINDGGSCLLNAPKEYTSSMGRTVFFPNEYKIRFYPTSIAFSSGQISIANSAFNNTHLVYNRPAIFTVPIGGSLVNCYTNCDASGIKGEAMGSSYTGTATTYNTSQLEYFLII